jgi:hypothetical protein
LAPRNLRGESQGMILMTTNAGGNSFVKPDTEAANGDYKLNLPLICQLVVNFHLNHSL